MGMNMKGESKATVNQDITQKSSEIINKQAVSRSPPAIWGFKVFDSQG